VIVSVSFQFVGFLLTYILHTTHAAKYGSRVGLGITLIQFGLNLRNKAEELLTSGHFPTDPSNPSHLPNANEDEIAAENTISAFWGQNSPWPASLPDPDNVNGPPIILHSIHEAELFALAHNTTLQSMLDLPSAMDVGRANQWFSFLLMSVGWFLVLTSVGGWWRVKRFEAGLKRAQRESEEAQAAANRGEEVADGGEPVSTGATSPTQPGPNSLAYYTTAFTDALRGVRGIQRGFFGMNGRRVRGGGHAPLPQDEGDVELFDADRFGLEPMASEGEGRNRGLWGV